ncbi:enterobactin synthase subunit F [Stenotrophomonas maltophilia]|uniref:enterobactin synthase subunit F n=2 Tax=Stenotrophomonas maltophilia TaxID=40324 RepID=UPI0013DA3B4B|nr:enterobactin synthase subunit F [Stenotrophomonas maltophilia]ELK2668394.1 enterobactin synthase subunit F [Stenotrophomonas maltophilia]MBH1375747.1 enterobactin synthase subunit F [Stenotrophomonas maltophilia]MBH1442176.1 enterobactin synthase subunit F [Stenotrophomonas maltophilia]MBN4989248.1 enterobactin synthase subunit F [Stenotrophomonas maltophilia]MCX3876831.1 enterobactin synthase subunit F [Stenotrophomonas maltophilia]
MNAVALATPVALTEAQAGLWFAQRLAPDNPSFNTAHAVWIDGPLDVAAFVAAADQAAGEAEAFALRFAEGADGQPLQWHDPAHVPLLSVRDVSAEADAAAAARSLMHADRMSPVDPTRDRISQQVLLELGGQRWVWYLRVHHLAADGYGMALFTDRVCALYAGRMGEPLPGLAGVLADDAAYRADPRRALAGQWWREHMQGAPAGVGLAGTLAASDDALRWVQPLDAAFREQLLQASVRWLQPWPDVLAALSAEYLRRMSAADEVVLGVPYMGRLGNASARVPAMVMNVLPLRVAAGEGSVEAFTRGLGRQLSQGRKHGRYRGEQLRRDLGLVGAQQRLHGPLVNVQPFYKALTLAGVQATLEVLCTGPVDDLTLGFRGDGQSLLDLEIEANPALYSREDVEAHAARLLHFVSAALQADDIAAVPLATPEEAQQVLQEFNATAHALPETTLVELLQQGMDRDPHAPALVFGDAALDYATLEARSFALAAQLRAMDVGPGSVVAVALPRSLELVIALVAVLRAGAAYLPLDLAHPDERLARILASAQPVCVLAAAEDSARMAGVPMLAPEQWTALSFAAPWADPAPSDAAYVIYTSGSTGEPKGVVIEHRAIVNRLLWMREHYGIRADDRVLQKTPATFDVSVWEFFLPLLCGATLVVAGPDAHRDPTELARLIRGHGVTTAHFVPSMLDAFLAAPASAGLQLRRVFTSGEALDASLRDRFHTHVHAELHNLYGPTEAAVDVSYWPASAQDRSRPVPIGFPVWNTRLYVLDARMQPVPIGVAGDLYLGGVQLARGYLGRDDLTAERFLADPFLPGERIYRAGDVARWRRDGAVEYLGRSDHQVKLRGLRIELGEIEATLRELPGMERVEVLLRQDAPGDARLVAYVPAAHADAVTLRSHLATRVPDYMVPSAFVGMDHWPVTANGKLDRNALPKPPQLEVAGLAPRTPLEQELALLFAQALGREAPVAVDADFFSLGGDSLSAVHLLLAIEQRWRCDLGLGALFAQPTVAALAVRIAEPPALADHALGPVIALAATDVAGPTPLFVLHPAGGIAWNYRTLARALQPARPVYGLQSPALDARLPLPSSIEAMANDYVQRVVALQPKGPVHLLGWSVGGILAQAMAVRLHEIGREVGELVLLDAYPSECWRAEPEPDAIAALRALLAIAGHDPDAHPELDSRERILAFLRRGGSALGSLPDVVLDGVVRAVTGTNRLIREHIHQPFDGTLVHVRAGRDHQARPQLQSALWRTHARKVQALELPFLHAELTGRDAVAQLAPWLSARLRQWDEQQEIATCSCPALKAAWRW